MSMRLHLGCGNNRLEGWLNADLYRTSATDVTFDLMQPWPLDDDKISECYASHVLEHLPDPIHFFKELWRVCQNNAQVILRLPYGASDAAFWDLTHLRPWFAENFAMLQPGYAQAIGNHQHDEYREFFGVIVTMRLNPKVAVNLRKWYFRRWIWPYVKHIWNAVDELHVHLWALKTEEAVAQYRADHPGHCIQAAYGAWEHQLEGHRLLPEGRIPKLINIHEGYVVNGWY